MSINKYLETIVKELNDKINFGIQMAQKAMKGKKLFDEDTGLPTSIDNMYYAAVTVPLQKSGYNASIVNSFDTCVAFLIASFDGLNNYVKQNRNGIDAELKIAIEEHLIQRALLHLVEKYDQLRENKEFKAKFKTTFKHFCSHLGDLNITYRKDCDTDICSKLLKGKAIIDAVKSCRKTNAIRS